VSQLNKDDRFIERIIQQELYRSSMSDAKWVREVAHLSANPANPANLYY
jgi:hypothetical protein